MEIIIRNGRVINGLGDPIPYTPWVNADIGIENGKIEKIGNLSSVKADRIIDASNLMVSPGIINMHSHSDRAVLIDGKCESEVRQGITTESVGACGGSAAPVTGKVKELRLASGVEVPYETMGEYMSLIEKQGVSVNVAPFVGHNPIRLAVMGYEQRAPTQGEMEEMKTLLRQSLDDGAWGFTTGLIYIPGAFSEEEELTELCKTAAEYDIVHKTHMRGGGDRVFAALMEVLRITERTGIRLHVLHHKAMGDRNSAKILYTLPMIDDTIAKGFKVTIGMYPYEAGSGGLGAALPPWMHEGGREKLVERLKDPSIRERLKREMIEPELVPNWESYVAQSDWEECWSSYQITTPRLEKNKWMKGKTLEEVRPKWQDPFDFLFDLLVEEGGSVGFVLPDVFKRGDKYLRIAIRYPNFMFEGDSSALTVDTPRHPHPRNFGWAVRALRKYVREERVVTFHEAIRKMTSLPAQMLGIEDRGVLAEGMAADIMIFDPRIVGDKATFEDPRQYPAGVNYVIVNGQIVIDQGEHTSLLPGKVLRHKKP